MLDVCQSRPAVLVVAIVLVPVLRSGKPDESLQPLFVGILLMLLGILPGCTILATLAQEGSRMALLRSAPISMADVLGAKL